MTSSILTVLIATWFAAGFAVGLWWGERGRRLDLQWLIGLQTAPTRSPTPVVRKEEVQEERELREAEISEVAVTILSEAERMGLSVTPAQAKAEAERLVLAGDALGASPRGP